MSATKLDQACEALRRLPEPRQEELAEAVLLAASAAEAAPSPALLAAVDEGLADADVGRLVPEADTASLLERYQNGDNRDG